MYCTQDDLKEQISEQTMIELADDDGDGVPDAGIIDALITESGDMIDSYLRDKYLVPFTDPPVLIKRICRNLTVCALYRRRLENLPDSIRDLQQEQLALLEKLASGQVRIGAPVADADPAQDRGYYQVKRTDDERIRIY